MARLVVCVANILAFVLALIMLAAPVKVAGKTDAILIYFIVLFIVDAFFVAPVAWGTVIKT